MDKEWEDNQRKVREMNQLRDERQKESSRRQLEISVEKRLKTTMIGAIASIEEAFGWLFNYGDPQTPQEKENYETFQELRNEILDKGNRQIRELGKDLDNYSIVWHKFKTHFIFRGDKDNG